MTSHVNTQTDRPDVSFAILATRDPALIRACLDSIAATATGDVRTEIVVVLGDASPEVEAVVRAAEGVRVIASDVNIGTAAAGNLAFDAARAPYVFSLHEDTELLPGCVARLLQTAEALPRAGAIGTRVLNVDGTLQHAGTVLWRSAELTPLVEATAPELVSASEPYRVSMTAASAMFVRRSAWDEVGGFDESFFPFTYVDVDFSVALRAHGYDVLVDPRAQTTHRRGASQAPGGGALSTLRFRDWIYVRNRSRLLAKWGAAIDALPALPPDVHRTEVPAQVVAQALPEPVVEAVRGAPRAGRVLTPPGGEGIRPDGSIPPATRRRLLDAEHEVLAAFAAALVDETEERATEVRSLWSALEEARAYNETVYSELTTVGERLAVAISNQAALEHDVGALRADLEGARARADALQEHLAARDRDMVWLRERSDVYEQIVSGRWWRLRDALYRMLGRQA